MLKSPLDGIRIIELTAFHAGPLGVELLAEAGAEAIKIEGLPGGDPIRGATALAVRGRPAGTHNWSHEYLNRNKKSVAVNLEDKRTRQIIYRLVGKSDVFISNLRALSLEKWGLDYDSLAGVNPRLIYAYGAGFGSKGPDASRPVLDLLGQARSGVLGLSGDPEGFSMAAGMTPCDKTTALFLAYGVMLALWARERTGLGQKLETSNLAAGIYLAGTELSYYLGTGETSPEMNRSNVANPLRNLYRTRDGRWLVFNMSQGDRYWPEFCQALGIEHLEHEPGFESMAARAEHRAELISVLEKVFAQKTKDEWVARLAKYNLLWALVQTLPEVAADAQVLENEYLVACPHPHLKNVMGIGPLIRMGQTPLGIGQPAPELGQHTEQVLTEIGGYTWADLTGFKNEGIII